jgi:hypothetical protein
MKHFRWHSARRRVVIDSHDLRLGLFWVKHESAWLHLSGIVIRLREREPRT